MNRMIVGLAIMASLGLAQPSQGTGVVEPDAVPADTNLHTAFSGITLWRRNGLDGHLDAGIFAREVSPFATSTGTRVFGHAEPTGGSPPFGLFWSAGANATSWQLRADFAAPVQSAAIDVLDISNDSRGIITAYDGAGNQLGAEVITDLTSGTSTPVVAAVSRPTAEIAYVLVGGLGGNTVLLDNLRYTVPEPSAGILIFIAFLAWLLRRR